ncbi:nucleoside phosphorylase [Sunxiuqinia indica]|uniref:nucleoside phosphorylase n=1 Tax=Sunxiuqinia indica TaxID=2692584 RepID=UPI00135CD542|nr:nucleoside phosphorylase [Sunxiuqinia indica]
MIGSSELIINKDGSIFHLHLKPENIADYVILVGDPSRVKAIQSFLSEVEYTVQNREFVSTTGKYNNTRITVISTGIGTDNIDIVLNELDALVNIDLDKRKIKDEKRSLKIIRIGTSGGMQKHLPVNSFVVSKKAIGFDGLLNFYADRELISDIDFEKNFFNHTEWNTILGRPYVVDCSPLLLRLFSDKNVFHEGVTISAPGFYGPQGRELRLKTIDPSLNEKIESFYYKELQVTNYEMECSAIYGLSALLGHEAVTVCLIIASRTNKEANESYHTYMEKLIELVLEKISNS